MRELKDWPVWWRELSGVRKVAPVTAISTYLGVIYALGGLRGDHLAMCCVLMVVFYGGRTIARSFLPFALPFLLTAMLYDSQRFYGNYIRGPIHVTEPYNFDKTLFGIRTESGLILTPNEWWQLHTYPALDLITGFAYLAFFSVYILIAGYFYFWVSRKGTTAMSPARVREKAKRMGLSFFWLNVLGYSTYYWYSASPPWYVAQYGFGPGRTDVPASAAGALRFDELLGVHAFSEMYGRASNVHGAIPSMHISYPFLAMIFAFQFKRLRAFTICFYALMCFSAVYLNHHYILDILWGTSYTLIVAVAVDAYCEWKSKAAGLAPTLSSEPVGTA